MQTPTSEGNFLVQPKKRSGTETRRGRMIRAEETRLASAREQNEREKKRERTDRGMRNEGPAVQLNCYDIIRGDPSGTGGSVLSLSLSLSLEVVPAGADGGIGRGVNKRKGRRGERALELEPRSTETAAANHSFLGSTVVPFDQFIQGFKTFPRARPVALFRFSFFFISRTVPFGFSSPLFSSPLLFSPHFASPHLISPHFAPFPPRPTPQPRRSALFTVYLRYPASRERNFLRR